jgi:hypothetical protein
MDEKIKNYFHFVGISGMAGSGKDLFFTLCKEYLKKSKIYSTKVSLADKIKAEVEGVIKDVYGFSLKNCTRDQKNLIRPHLVFHGSVKRKQTQGRHWIEQAEETISKLYKNSLTQGITSPFVFITDIRYNEYKRDEAQWIKQELEGTLVHVEKFTPSPETNKQEVPTGRFLKEWATPPNLSEEKNDPRIQKMAHKLIKWQDYEGLPLPKVKKLLLPVVKSFIDGELKKLNLK